MKKSKYFTPEKWLENCERTIYIYGEEFRQKLVREGCLIWGDKYSSVISDKIYKMKQSPYFYMRDNSEDYLKR